MRWSIAPYFLVKDVVAAANVYRDQLGFKYDRFWGEPPCFCMVRRAGVTILLSEVMRGSDESRTSTPPNPNSRAAPGEDCWDAYLWVDNADALHAEFKRNGVKIARELCDQEYGCRDFEVEDLDGYRLCFGHDLNP